MYHSVNKTERESKRKRKRERNSHKACLPVGNMLRSSRSLWDVIVTVTAPPWLYYQATVFLLLQAISYWVSLGVYHCYPHEGIVTGMLLDGFMWMQYTRKCLCFLATQDKDNHNQCHWMWIPTRCKDTVWILLGLNKGVNVSIWKTIFYLNIQYYEYISILSIRFMQKINLLIARYSMLVVTFYIPWLGLTSPRPKAWHPLWEIHSSIYHAPS